MSARSVLPYLRSPSSSHSLHLSKDPRSLCSFVRNSSLMTSVMRLMARRPLVLCSRKCWRMQTSQDTMEQWATLSHDIRARHRLSPVLSVFGLVLDDMPIHCRGVPGTTDATTQPHRLVCEAEAEPSTAAQTAKWRAPESSSHFRFPSRSSCVFSLSVKTLLIT